LSCCVDNTEGKRKRARTANILTRSNSLPEEAKRGGEGKGGGKRGEKKGGAQDVRSTRILGERKREVEGAMLGGRAAPEKGIAD